MTTPEADSAGQSGLEDSLPRAQSAEPELDDCGVTVCRRCTPGWMYLLAPVALFCGIVSFGLGGYAESVHGRLTGYQNALGILSSSLAMLLPLAVLSQIAKGGRIKAMGIAVTGSMLGLVGFLLLASAVWHWRGGGA